MELRRKGLGELGFPIRDGDGLLKAAQGIHEKLVFSFVSWGSEKGSVLFIFWVAD